MLCYFRWKRQFSRPSSWNIVQMRARRSLASFLLISVKRFSKTIINRFCSLTLWPLRWACIRKSFSFAKGSCVQLPFAVLFFAHLTRKILREVVRSQAKLYTILRAARTGEISKIFQSNYQSGTDQRNFVAGCAIPCEAVFYTAS